MGKRAREERRKAARLTATAASSPEHRPRRRMLLLGAGVVTLVALVLAAGSALGLGIAAGSGGGAQIPQGTAVFAEPNHQHVSGTVQYDRTPPAGGAHSAVWLNCGVYTGAVPNVNAVHSLEHGAVWITYQPNLAASSLTQLRQFVEAHYRGTQRYLILSPYAGLPAPIVASAWGAQLRADSPGDTRLAAFVAHYAGGAQGGEPGGECTGGTGTPIA